MGVGLALGSLGKGNIQLVKIHYLEITNWEREGKKELKFSLWAASFRLLGLKVEFYWRPILICVGIWLPPAALTINIITFHTSPFGSRYSSEGITNQLS